MLWCMATDLTDQQQGLAIAMRLGGMAKVLVRELDPMVLANGQAMDLNDGNGPQLVGGVTVIMRALNRQFGEHDVDTGIRAIASMMHFRRLPNETVACALARFYSLKHRAEGIGNFTLGRQGYASDATHGSSNPSCHVGTIPGSNYGSVAH
eukprot:4580498-Karenia_brevis.AAC.1